MAVMTDVTDRSGQDQELKEEALWQGARRFVLVPRRKAMIMRYARKFMRFSPYEMRDYIAEAHLAACQAMTLCRRNGEPDKCERYFWTLVKSAFARMSTNPAQRDVIPGQDAGPLAVVFEEYTEEWSDEEGRKVRPTGAFLGGQYAGRAARLESIDSILRARQVRAALAAMTPRQREVWSLLLEGRDTNEVACILGGSRQNAEKLRETGLAKVKRCVKGGFVR